MILSQHSSSTFPSPVSLLSVPISWPDCKTGGGALCAFNTGRGPWPAGGGCMGTMPATEEQTTLNERLQKSPCWACLRPPRDPRQQGSARDGRRWLLTTEKPTAEASLASGKPCSRTCSSSTSLQHWAFLHQAVAGHCAPKSFSVFLCSQ